MTDGELMVSIHARARRATRDLEVHRVAIAVSIHARARRATPLGALAHSSAKRFQSTPAHGGRRPPLFILAHKGLFQSGCDRREDLCATDK